MAASGKMKSFGPFSWADTSNCIYIVINIKWQKFHSPIENDYFLLLFINKYIEINLNQNLTLGSSVKSQLYMQYLLEFRFFSTNFYRNLSVQILISIYT